MRPRRPAETQRRQPRLVSPAGPRVRAPGPGSCEAGAPPPDRTRVRGHLRRGRTVTIDRGQIRLRAPGDSATRDFDREVERFLERWRPVVASLMDDLLLRPPSVLGAIRHAGQLSRLRGTAGEAVRSAFSRRLGPGCAGRVPAVCRRARGPGPRSVDRRTRRPARRGLLPAGWRRKLDSRRARRWPGVARRPREPALPDRTHPRVPRGAPSGRTRSTCRTGAGVLACAMGTSPGFRRGLGQSGVG
jgi:hypothetical protein